MLQQYYLPDYEVGWPVKVGLLAYEEDQSSKTALLGAEEEKLLPVVVVDDGEDLDLSALLLQLFPALLDGYHQPPGQRLVPRSMSYREALLQEVAGQRVFEVGA